MTAGNTLVLMACSQKKREASVLAELYDGPLWQTLRTHKGMVPWANVFVLSARYGFSAAYRRGVVYEARLTSQMVDDLIARGLHEPPRDKHGVITGLSHYGQLVRPFGYPPYDRVIIAASGDYLRFLRWLVTAATDAGLIIPAAPVHTTEGGIGRQRQQLAEYLVQARRVTEPA